MPTEDILLAYVEQLEKGRIGHRAICFHLSRLDRVNRREKHLQIATNMLKGTVDQFAGRLFVLRSSDIVLVCRGITGRAIDQAIGALRYLFNHDKLVKQGQEAHFYSVFDLEVGYPQFLALIQGIRDREAKQRAKVAKRPPVKPIEQRLNEVLEALSSADISQMVRRQSVWHVQPDRKPAAKFDEVFVSIEKLNQAISPDIDISKDKHLFQYLSRWLDKHMLTRLAWEKFGNARPMSFNINLSTLQSQEFLKFDQGRTSGLLGRVILELQLGDVWADLGTYLAVAEALKLRGYLRCLDAVGHQAFACINFRHLKVDLVKLFWDDSMLKLETPQLQVLHHALRDCGIERVILAHCGSPEAFEFGQAIGLQLFQGWHLDRLQTNPSAASD